MKTKKISEQKRKKWDRKLENKGKKKIGKIFEAKKMNMYDMHKKIVKKRIIYMKNNKKIIGKHYKSVKNI